MTDLAQYRTVGPSWRRRPVRLAFTALFLAVFAAGGWVGWHVAAVTA